MHLNLLKNRNALDDDEAQPLKQGDARCVGLADTYDERRERYWEAEPTTSTTCRLSLSLSLSDFESIMIFVGVTEGRWLCFLCVVRWGGQC